jgi:DNA mismatch repair protein MutL
VPVIEQPTAIYSPPQQPSRPLFAGWTPPLPAAEPTDVLPVNRAITTTPWKDSLPALRLLGQLAASYIVAEGPDGLYLIDQHAAHERIRFERIRRQRAEQKVEVQGLLEPITFEATPRQEVLLKSQLPALAAFGFSLEPFGGSAYLVRAVPAGMDGKDCLAALRELLDSPQDNSPSADSWMEKIAISIACHGGIRAGQVLSTEEMRQLVRELEQTDLPHTCPHGRPTMTRLTLAQLEREFKRT